jgi:hypothetical protein
MAPCGYKARPLIGIWDPALSAQRLGSREFEPTNIGYIEDSSAGGVGPNVD